MRKAMVLLIAILAIGSLGVGLGPMAGTAQDLDAETRRGGPDRAASYINPDTGRIDPNTGMSTENPNVKRNSECRTPDQKDRQRVSPQGTNDNNVHNDACLFTANGRNFDGPVSFEIEGVGEFSACPDPDNVSIIDNGPKTAAVKNMGKRCYMTGYQETGAAGDLEYHARLDSSVRGESVVTFCHDPQDNGCRDAKVEDTIRIVWKR